LNLFLKLASTLFLAIHLRVFAVFYNRFAPFAQRKHGGKRRKAAENGWKIAEKQAGGALGSPGSMSRRAKRLCSSGVNCHEMQKSMNEMLAKCESQM